jgi:hypothetical protein
MINDWMGVNIVQKLFWYTYPILKYKKCKIVNLYTPWRRDVGYSFTYHRIEMVRCDYFV